MNIKKESYSLFLTLNFYIFIIFAVTNLTPYFSRRVPLTIQIALLSIWLLTAFLHKPIFFMKINILTFWVIVWILYLIFTQLIGYADNAIGNLLSYITFWFSLVILNFYSDNLNIKKTRLLKNYIMITMIINILLNIKELVDKPYLSKYITGGYDAHELGLSSNVGNYSYVILVGIIMIVLLNMSFTLKNRIYKLLACTLSICCYYMVTLASSMIGILSSIIMIIIYIFSYVTKNSHIKKILFICFLVGIASIILLFQDFFYVFLKKVSLSMENEMIADRFSQIIDFIFGIGNEVIFSERPQLYGYSIKTFLSNFFIGIGRRHTSVEGIIGLHSQILDDMAYFGIVGIIMQALILSKFYKLYLRRYFVSKQKHISALAFAYTAGVLYFALFNPLINMNSGIIIFIFIPLFCKTAFNKVAEEEKDK